MEENSPLVSRLGEVGAAARAGGSVWAGLSAWGQEGAGGTYLRAALSTKVGGAGEHVDDSVSQL